MIVAFLVALAIFLIAVVIIANTTDVDSMADPAPRHGEDDHRPALHRAQTAWFPDRSGWDQQ